MTAKRAKISILLPDLRGGGVERIRIVLAHEIARCGHEVEFVLMRAQGELLEEARKNFTVVCLGTPRIRSLPVALARYLRSQRPDVLLAAMWPLTVIAPMVASLPNFKCRVVVSEHGILSAQYRDRGWLHRAVLRFSTFLGYRLAKHRVGVSSGLVKDMARLSWMKRNNFHKINNPLPPRSTPSSEALEACDTLWSAPPGGRILTVGTMKAVKNHQLLLRAFARMNRPDARLMFVGAGAGVTQLRTLAGELGLTSQVIFAGFHPDPTPFYMTADLFVLSSDYEGFGNVIVEALASGTPVVSTDCPSGPAEILENGKYGKLVPVRDPEALAAAMQASLDAPREPEFLKKRASDFLPAIAADRYLELLCP